jgi:hypothetical protein
VNSSDRRKVPPSHSVPSGLQPSVLVLYMHVYVHAGTYPKMIACHENKLSAAGAALTPCGGSVFNFFRSRIRRRRASVDIVELMWLYI